MQELVRAVREVRNRYSLDPRASLEVFVRCDQAVAEDFRALTDFIASLGGVGRLACGPEVTRPPQAATHIDPDFEIYVSLRGLIDVEAETKRLEKQLAEKFRFMQTTQAKLANKSFVEKAPADVVQQQRELLADLENQIRVLEGNRDDLRQG
jgi:valyl-tRNA synthetase